MGSDPNNVQPAGADETPETEPTESIPDPEMQILERGVPPQDIEKRDE
jgi:hypothetical protein